MIRFFKVAFIFAMSLMIFSCHKNEDPTPEYVVPFAEQYPRDIAAIDKYLDEYHMDVAVLDGSYDVTFKKISIMPTPGVSIRNQTDYPLLNKTVNRNGVNYKVYYISLREGTKERPTKVDSAFVSYKGYLLNETVFDQAQNPVWFTLDRVIQGWRDIMPLFKSGTFATDADGTVNYTNFGAGVMFLPSGLAYYNGSRGAIPSYSPLIFTFKLKGVNYVDHDYDRIDSKDEDVDGDGDPTNDDSDADGYPNYLDIDDDGDGYSTKSEIKKPTPLSAGQGTSLYYPFSPIVDDPTTTINESEPKGIPSLSGDGDTPTRLRRHLDKNAKPPYITY
ncbi:putative lipoprotein [Flavobacterium psychrophilum]|uniref:FKBP-type peptidyl-prolyl cis-trans isomerase n=1 Tax=Flavobacterium psychrophilum TaxID=96345 RepID=UPI000B7C1D2D|nr:FKBP-type peptidyl-prolyl cis-trans isomerase [Flavobacterium psychrophilum]SNB29941.1 putative lipoprotein [Flavobacterium psychrophilum]